MHRPMEGVRVLEVAQFTFVPAAGAVLADWGADVVKIEHAERGDGQRGLSRVLGLETANEGSTFLPIMEGPNRGKRSVGLALEKPAARPVLEALVRASDVFLTNFLPGARAKLRIDVEDIRALNPDIVYVRGSGFGARGPEATKGGYDSTAFWARGGSAAGVTPPGAERMARMPAGAYGDSIGGMTIAGGIAAALYARAVTGEPAVIDVSLLGVGAWATQYTVNQALMRGGPLPVREQPRYGSATNPLVGSYRTADGRWIELTMLQPGRYWPEFCRLAGRADLATDERFDTVDRLMANAGVAAELVADIIASRPHDEWVAVLSRGEGQWAAVQNSWEVGQDPALRANGMIARVVDAEGVERELVANPVQFGETPVTLTRAPLFAEHTDEVLRELGLSDDELIELKLEGAVT
ncbi:CaiB/BaiF CoA transferase family protein [Actinophytocola oryzae]|uniref:Crotonobetainyl-CoA:carnitine CoA-transferase CaiB-like acyl-CoA transferase n=1 Tax=Actinophytocola oryzae TaxID=502181 RepID=A0A4R7W0H2_9PSEU|nr:CoA transferase [Actinophytocola oryzae]TDV56003.1 crotonobetainyl-CoA:carnitine CoA-transferase CaiB-like acyl-CoA transferase [Actinophytocola oryzae]